MHRDIERGLSLGVSGFATGVLEPDSTIDVPRMRSLVAAARGSPLTFHRAFDATPDVFESLERLIDAGVARVLTSGGAPTAMEGIDVLARLVQQAKDRITVIAAGKIREHNVREVISRTRVAEVHARVVDEDGARRLVQAAIGSPSDWG
jgi:copper homeostasis protein